MPIDFKKIEKKWQKRWEKSKIFEANPKKKKKFFMTVPYPYASGPLHVGHGRTSTNGDIYTRFMRMKGLNVLWPMAFHITGTPVLGISDLIRKQDQETIQLFKEYVSLHIKERKKVEVLVESFGNPWNVANFFAGTMISDFRSLGFSIDWRRKFTTGDKEYASFIQWQFRKLKEKGYIIQGAYPILFCVNCNNAVGEDDIKGGDVIKPEVGEYTLVKFKLEESYLPAATLRPETIFGTTNLWINPEKIYVKAKVDNEIWIISERAAEKLKKQGKKVKILESFPGHKLVGKYVSVPTINREVIILPADFVDVNESSGIVYSVPAHAPWDWIGLKVLKENSDYLVKYRIDPYIVKKIEPISIIKLENYGEFPAIEECEKLGIKNLEDKEKIDLATETIYKEEFYNGILKENCENYNGLKVAEAKERIVDELKNINAGDKFYEVIAKEKPVKCKCNEDVIVAVLQDQWFIDYGNEGWKEKVRQHLKKMEIVPEIYRKQFEDVVEWLHERPCARKRGIGTELPFEKGWIIESLSDSTIYMALYTVIHIIKNNEIKPEQLKDEVWNYIFLGEGDSEKIEKVSGIKSDILKKMRREFEYWYPNDHRHTAIGHISNHLIFFIFNHLAIFPSKHWPRKITLNEYVINEGRKMSKSFGNVIPSVEASTKYGADLYRLHASNAVNLQTTLDWREKDILTIRKGLENFFSLVSSYRQKKKEQRLDDISKWLYSKFNRIIDECTKNLENFRIRNYVQKSFFELMSLVLRYRKRENKKSLEKYVLNDIFKTWIKLLAPVIPHVCEELWWLFGQKGFVSLEKWPKPNKKLINKKVEELEEILNNTKEDLAHIIKLAGKKKIAYIYVTTDKELDYFKETLEHLKKQFGFKKVFVFKSSDPKRYDPQGKTSKAKYGKPGIYLE